MNIQRWLWRGLWVGVGLSLITLILAVATVKESRWWQHWNTRYFTSRATIMYPSFDRVAHYSSKVQWKREENGQSTLVHGIITSSEIPYKSTSTSNDPTQEFAALGSPRGDMPVGTTTVAVLPKGLYVNNTRMETSESVRIFVLDKHSVVHPIELTPAEMQLFQPNNYPAQLSRSALFREKILPLLDPDLIEREKRKSAVEQEQKEFAALKARGIETVRESWLQDGVFCSSHWISHPNGTCPLLCAFITRLHPNNQCHYDSNLETGNYARLRNGIPKGSLEVFFEVYPSHYSINGERLEPGKPYVQCEDGSVVTIVLTPEENQQFTRELLSKPTKFFASDLFIQKIAPLIGPPIKKPMGERQGGTGDGDSRTE